MKYDYSDETQLSAHFNAREFRCKCGKTHDTEINPNLVTNLEKLYRALSCSKIIVTSGYRSPALNKAVHGAASSQHVVGQAADIHTVSDRPEENRKLLDLIIELGLPFDQVINEYPDRKGGPDWIHVSYGPRNRRNRLTCVRGKYKPGLNP